jgi:hypothetical protein
MKRFPPLVVSLAFAIAVGCTAGVNTGASGSGGGTTPSTTGGGGSTGSGGGTTPPPPACSGPCADFPADPVVDSGAPPNAATLFGNLGGGSGGPCLLEPAIGALFPNNWLRPRFRVSAPAGQDLFEIRLHASNQASDLVVYTANKTWTMPKSMWASLAAHTRDMPITVSVRGANSAGGNLFKGTQGTFTIAPVGASGTMVYWSTKGSTNGTPSNDDTLLSGFAVGDESVVQVLTPDQAANKPTLPVMDGAMHHCIGCHTSTPDGSYVSYNDGYPWGIVLASGEPDAQGIVGQSPPFLAVGGFHAITQPWTGISTYSAAHWAPGDHIMVAPLGSCAGAVCAKDQGDDTDQQSGLAWFDLESTTPGASPATLQGTAWDWIYKPATGAYAAAPSWSHDGSKVLFTMTNKVVSGRLATGTAHLYQVPYAKTPGTSMTATALNIAGSGNSADYYGSLSKDDKLIAFDRISATAAATTHMQLDGSTKAWDGMYAQPLAEVFVAPASGGSPTRLAANDPPQCAGVGSPGINNTWAKWSPEVLSSGGTKYYWLIFSSWREGDHAANGSPIAQLYVTAVTQDENGIHDFPAIYLWNQPGDISNHTPAWDVFQIPTVQ